ncbi:MAG: hypothetical protein FJ150_03155 [Euryarchaeota archaeon]|nr:hypothetical protein [Euryarchaeota archaeon]
MIEVKGTDESGIPQIIAFDGRVIEIFAHVSGRMKSRRFHIDLVKKIEIKERDDKPPLLYLELTSPAAFGTYEFKSGGENLYELIDAIKEAMNPIL